MTIQNSTLHDIDEIFRLYKIATDFQKTRYILHWPEFERSLIEKEITEQRQWKLLIDGNIACIWATTFSDPQIWPAAGNDAAVYIHRIATNPMFRGRHFVKAIVAWAKEFATHHNLQYIRMDTVGENNKLIDYYTGCGFGFLGVSKLEHTEGLPAHYDNAIVSLFELQLF